MEPMIGHACAGGTCDRCGCHVDRLYRAIGDPQDSYMCEACQRAMLADGTLWRCPDCGQAIGEDAYSQADGCPNCTP